MGKAFRFIKSKYLQEREDFKIYQSEITNANLKLLLRVSIIGTIYCAVLSLFSFPFIGILQMLPSYLALMALFIVFSVLARYVFPKYKKLILPVYYLLMFVIDAFAIYMGTFKGEHTNATTILLFLIILPMFIIDKPWRLILANFIITVLFIIAAFSFKNPGEIRSLDFSNIVVVFLISWAVIEIMVRKSIRNFELHRMVEDDLKEKNTLINALPVGVAEYEVKGANTKQVFMNDAFFRLFEDTREERVKRTGGNFINSIHPDDRAKLGAAIKKVIDGADYVTQPCRSMKGDGTYMWVRFSSSVAKREGDELIVYSTYSSMEDEMKSKEATQAKTDFLSRVSHDMRTPLNGILGITELMKEKATDPEQIEDLQQLSMSGNYLLSLINDTLDVSKIESGKFELHPVVCEGRTVFNNIISLANPNLQAKNIRFNVNAENLPFEIMYIDVARLEQIVMNILGNAIKFTPNGGTIDFTLENISIENGILYDRCTIKDSGIGMSKEFLPKLFEPFSQENTGKTNSFEGTGLGMTITKQIIEAMGGEIHAESELGKGTTISFTVKMQVASPEQIERWEKASKMKSDDNTLEGKRILLCEDHPLNVTIATRLLKKKGILVEHAPNGEKGLKMFSESPYGYYDLILMDIRMPIMDGLDATKAIRSLPRQDAVSVPIVAMTANAFDSDVKQVREAGMDEHLGKPIEVDKLYETLERMMHLNRSFRRRMILIVDDAEVNRAVIKESLQGEYIILEASNGVEALEMLKKHKGVDAVITDIQMPEMDGVELIKAIRANKEYRKMVIIANTQFGDPNQEEKLLSLGANDFVYKPTTPKIVEIRVRNALKKI